MKLRELLSEIEYRVVKGSVDIEITGISRDNRKAEEGHLFLCTTGARFDTHDEAVLAAMDEKGVACFVVEKDMAFTGNATVIRVDDTRIAGASVYAAWFGHPARSLTVIGVTGSKGKTTTTHMLADILRAGGFDCGTIGTNGVMYHDVQRELANTTPDFNECQAILREMVDAGVTHVVLEVSSQAMKKHRVDGILFDYGIWMNIQEGDHIGPNEHETFEDYLYCKAELLNRSKVGIIHKDDPFIDDLMKLVHVPAEFFGVDETSDYVVGDIKDWVDEEKRTPGTEFTLTGAISDTFKINFPGDYNAFNAVAAIVVANHLGVSRDAMKAALKNVHIKGRNDIVYRGKFSVCVDFAHNGESTWAHLRAMRAYNPKRLICIFGADGNRSKGRRYGMGEAAGTLADFSIVTSGHNRFESFEDILFDTEVGLKKAPNPKYIAIKNRKEAIRYMLNHAEEGDLITIIGLGHEHWQEENGVKTVYNDEEFVMEVLTEMGLL